MGTDKRDITVSGQSLERAFREFSTLYPEYESTRGIDDLRRNQYSRLDGQDQVYLDYTGGSLYADSQVEQHQEFLKRHVLGNPHSNNPSSRRMTEFVEETRQAVLQYFHASPDEYTAIFTQNATGALKLVGEAYPFRSDSRYILTFDNHNSVNGIREFAKVKNAEVQYIPATIPDLYPNEDRLAQVLQSCRSGADNLFAFPAQSNFSGVQYDFSWIRQARESGCDVLLDAAAFVPTNVLDLNQWHPDFVALSFYKMFGYPTGIGCLIAKKSALNKLKRPWFAGGTITLASVRAMKYQLAEGEAGFEDGTVNYLNIPAVRIGLEHLQTIGLDQIHNRVRILTNWLVRQLMGIVHANGRPLVRIYGPVNPEFRGGTVAFNLYDPQGNLLDFRRVEEMANDEGISLRTGCFCNPGVNEIAEGLTAEEMHAGFTESEEKDYPHFLSIIEHRDGKSAGAVRVSLGIVSDFKDVFRFVEFLRGFIDQSSQKIGQVRFDIHSCRRLRDGS